MGCPDLTAKWASRASAESEVTWAHPVTQERQVKMGCQGFLVPSVTRATLEESEVTAHEETQDLVVIQEHQETTVLTACLEATANLVTRVSTAFPARRDSQDLKAGQADQELTVCKVYQDETWSAPREVRVNLVWTEKEENQAIQAHPD